MTSFLQLFEVNFRDAWPKGFSEFYDKWKGKKKQWDLYVRFDNGNTMDSLHGPPSKRTTHSDMQGVYAYPLSYVIDHPGDIWYGHNSRLLKVIQDTSKKKVRLSSLTRSRADSLLWGANLPDLDTMAKYFPERAKGVTAPGKLFMSAVQMDISGADSPRDIKIKRRNGREVAEPKVRSSEEQTALFRKMGIDALEDDASSINQAAINDREPQQICWLTTSSFKVLETFRLSDPKAHHPQDTFDDDRLLLKVAALLAQAMDDKLVPGRTMDDHHRYWTKGGRLITLEAKDTSLSWRMNNLKMGQKKHKMYRKNDKTSIRGDVQSERGKFPILIFDDGKVNDAVAQFASSWSMRRGTDNGERWTKAAYIKAEQEAKEAYWKEQEVKERADLLRRWPTIEREFNAIADHYGLPHMPPLTDEQKCDTMTLMRYAGLVDLTHRYPQGHVPTVKVYEKMIEKIPEEWLSRLPDRNLGYLVSHLA